jgi:hypothetical protein
MLTSVCGVLIVPAGRMDGKIEMAVEVCSNYVPVLEKILLRSCVVRLLWCFMACGMNPRFRRYTALFVESPSFTSIRCGETLGLSDTLLFCNLTGYPKTKTA